MNNNSNDNLSHFLIFHVIFRYFFSLFRKLPLNLIKDLSKAGTIRDRFLTVHRYAPRIFPSYTPKKFTQTLKKIFSQKNPF